MTMSSNRSDRLDLIGRWEVVSSTSMLVFGTRRDATQSDDDCVRTLYEHLRELPQRPVDRIDVLLMGDGLQPEVGARIGALLREYGREIRVAIPSRLGPGETLAAVAADSLIMHPLAALTTVLPTDARGDLDEGLDGLVAHALFARDADRALPELPLGAADPAALGRSLHRLNWSRRTVAALARLRLNPPDADETSALMDSLCLHTLRTVERIDRRTARAMDGLEVLIPTPEQEALLFDLHLAYEALLGPKPAGEPTTRAIIESSPSLHTLDDGADTPQWVRRPDNEMH